MERPSNTCSICGKPSPRNRMQIIWRPEGTELALKTWAHGTCKRNFLHESPKAFRFHVKIWVAIVDQATRRTT